MPMHEYECFDCGNKDIKIYFGSEKVEDTFECPKCVLGRMERIISASAFFVKQGECGNAESGYSDFRNVKPMDQKRSMARAQSEAANLNKGRNPR